MQQSCNFAAGYSKTGRIWDLNGNVLHVLEGHTSYVNGCDCSPDGQHVLTCSDDESIRIYTSKGEFIRSLEGHLKRVWRSRFTLDGNSILSASADETAKIWTLVIFIYSSQLDPIYSEGNK